MAEGRGRLFARRDFYAGGLMVVLGSLAAFVGPSYELGTLTQMGPGFFPTVLGVILLLLGVAIALSSSVDSEGEGESTVSESPQWRAWICILAGPVLFIVCGTIGGMIPGTFACVFVSAFGDRTATLKSAFTLATIVTVFGVGLFSYVLQVPMPILAWRGI